MLILVALIAGMVAMGRFGEQMQPRSSCSCGGHHEQGGDHDCSKSPAP